jgi:hypothetical protein
MATTKKTLSDRLVAVQSQLKAPKGQYNSFGKYAYRSAEDILEAVKPLLAKNGLSMTISDEVMLVGSLAYINATVEVFDGEDSLSASAQAGIDPSRKGMDIAQSFGSSSSYARKYALNGMFLIDDTKDADATNDHKPRAAAPTQRTSTETNTFQQAIEYIKAAKTKSARETAYKAVMGKYGDTWSDKQKEAISKFVK